MAFHDFHADPEAEACSQISFSGEEGGEQLFQRL